MKETRQRLITINSWSYKLVYIYKIFTLILSFLITLESWSWLKKLFVIKLKTAMRDRCNQFSILRILETDYTCYALQFFSLSLLILALSYNFCFEAFSSTLTLKLFKFTIKLTDDFIWIWVIAFVFKIALNLLNLVVYDMKDEHYLQFWVRITII